MFAVDQRNMQCRFVPPGYNTCPDSHVVDQPETKVTASRQIDANPRASDLLERKWITFCVKTPCPSKIILIRQQRISFASYILGKLWPKAAVDIIGIFAPVSQSPNVRQ